MNDVWDLQRRFCNACKIGDLLVVQNIIELYPDFDVNYDNGGIDDSPALLDAVAYNRLSVVQELLKHPDVNVNIRAIGKHSPFSYACCYDYHDVALELLKHPKLFIIVEDDTLYYACRNRNKTLALEILKRMYQILHPKFPFRNPCKMRCDPSIEQLKKFQLVLLLLCVKTLPSSTFVPIRVLPFGTDDTCQ